VLAAREQAQNHQWLTLVSTADWRCDASPKPRFLTCDEHENFTLQNIMGTFTEPWFRKVLKDGQPPTFPEMRNAR